ncbi:cyanophycinase [Telluria aromaticivorans]|uniref:Cyanophycinase n=1 Tax=Telluria aromaticivorans TaxID=2725995 RepID=A0A7Y2K0F1_9BURK|nr:cyanophycinase [Telluria aromaticivorans]NNG23134.1 cyanophycinase [Telluria aromaticivorans]
MFQAAVHLVARALLAIALLTSQSLGASEAPQPKGSLVIIGGALRSDNAAVWERMVQLAGGKGARIAVFASASANPDKAGKALVERFNHYGAKAFFVPVATHLAGTDYQAAADDPALAASVRSASGAFFAGGDQGRITRALRRADGSNTRMLDALWEMYRRGGLIAGTSAGAAIMSSTMFGHPKTVLATLKLGLDDGKEITPGLGFIGEDVFIDQHLLVRGRFARMVPAMLKKGYKIGLGVDENTAIVVGPNREVEVIGYRGALLVDLSKAVAQYGPLHVSNVRLSYLDNGDRFSLASQSFTPSPDKAENRIDPAKPYYREPLFSADILGNSTVVDLMARLIDSDQPEAIGLSFDSAHGIQPDLGFEFKLTRTGESVGYMSALTEQYSVYKLRLDIRPIVVQRPLYQYRQADTVAASASDASRADAAR